KEYQALRKSLEIPVVSPPLPPVESTTRDETVIHLAANIENPEQVELMLRHRLEGIGLFRTEFLALSADTIPGEEEQYAVYRRVIEEAAGRRVVIRTFDIGADKQNPNIYRDRGQNPALGVRGIRRHLICCPDELRVQLRAILRAAENGEVGILLPMVTTVEDIRRVKRHLEIARKELRREKKPFSPKIALGAMIEIPAAAFAAGEILKEVNFVSVGTNDLLQYFLAADRDNPELVEYGENPSPGFLSLMRLIIEQATAQGRQNDVAICGEMAANPSALPALIRLGYRSFSVSPILAPAVRAAAAATHLDQASPAIVRIRRSSP
ncbi:MAG: putative PEP-binding protein, partial [Candidatus Erginobacter occultus]|nr:putative PEP-binding protein [Candidatus Erginobacter occultus]